MLKKLRLQLSLLCVAMTGAVFAAFMLLVVMLTEAQYNRMNETMFQSRITELSSRLQSGNFIDVDWLAEMENTQSCVVALENNGVPMRYQGAWDPGEPREQLLERIRARALANGVDYREPPGEPVSQWVFSMDRYRCAVAKIAAGENWFSVTVANDISQQRQHIRSMRGLYLLLSLGVFAALALLSWWFTGRVLRPTFEGMERQREFVAAASHELRSPLTVIEATASAIRLVTPKADELTYGIENECGRMGRLVNDLLLLANTDTTAWRLHLAPVELDTILIETVEKYQEPAAKRGFTLDLDLPEEMLPPINGDAGRLEQVFSILLDNAVSHAGKPGALLVRAAAEARMVTVQVIDHGVGVAPEERERIFDRFYRADKSRSDKKHFGLGLSVALELARLHNGTITLLETPGGGCTFQLTLPTI